MIDLGLQRKASSDQERSSKHRRGVNSRNSTQNIEKIVKYFNRTGLPARYTWSKSNDMKDDHPFKDGHRYIFFVRAAVRKVSRNRYYYWVMCMYVCEYVRQSTYTYLSTLLKIVPELVNPC